MLKAHFHRIHSPTKCANGTPIRVNSFVTAGVGFSLSSTTNQNKLARCFSVYPNRVNSANCSPLRKVGVMM